MLCLRLCKHWRRDNESVPVHSYR